MGVARRTFLVGADGIVARTWEKVSPDGHAADVVAAIDQAGGAAHEGRAAWP